MGEGTDGATGGATDGTTGSASGVGGGGGERPGADDRSGVGDRARTPGTPAPDARTGTSGTGATGTTGAAQRVEPPVPFTQQLGRVTVIVLAALFGVFAVANAQRVAFSWVFGGTEVVEGPAGTTGGVPLIVLLLVSFVVGGLTGALVSRRRRRGAR